ncbi:TetR/AcrR family transcriptional regulator [Hwanghaeella grinnelliae]|uniref:TetR/AcrR family transcriptional regulator n=1 Tax=Hwanghaeella grinnelliae TaxID=2500179 RepID=A0A3S2WUK0_9PROT|nr:TetR/AcrR family transcriptional regulator [Hwanghaeella grinnelliae]RVU38842.1 TetR/AcrR family transcriptional regulator [Hwanghaeella grinnelliae]
MSRDAAETREKILNSTLDLLEAGDPHRVRMSDIAKAAGVSRQAVYLHFPSRAELLIAATYLLDDRKGVEERLVASRSAGSGRNRLDAYVDCWAGYLPEIAGVARAFLAMVETDAEAASAWNQRMEDVREGCEAVVKALKADGDLAKGLTIKAATDLFWTLLSVRNWEQLTRDCGWSEKEYGKYIKAAARAVLVKGEGG